MTTCILITINMYVRSLVVVYDFLKRCYISRVLESCRQSPTRPKVAMVMAVDTRLVVPSECPIRAETPTDRWSITTAHQEEEEAAVDILQPPQFHQRILHRNRGNSTATQVRRVLVVLYHPWHMKSNCPRGCWRDSRLAVGVRGMKQFQNSRHLLVPTQLL